MIFNMKKENRIPLKNGYLTFLRDRLEISDNCGAEKTLILIGFFISTLYGLWCVLSYNAIENPIMYYSGIMILLTWALASPFLIRRTYKQVLYYKEIGNINMLENPGGDFKARIKLKRGRIRFVHLKKSQKHVRLFLNNLNEFHLKTAYHFLSA